MQILAKLEQTVKVDVKDNDDVDIYPLTLFILFSAFYVKIWVELIVRTINSDKS